MTRRIVFILFLSTFLLVGCEIPCIAPQPSKFVAIPSPTEATPTIGYLKPTPFTTVQPQSIETISATPTQLVELPIVSTALEVVASVPNEVYPFRYAIQSGSPRHLMNINHPELACNWTGIGGQVFGMDGQPKELILVEIGGVWQGQPVSFLTLTGSEIRLGPGGYEVTFSNQPASSDGELWVVIYDLDGTQLIDRTSFVTYNDCERNFVLMNFVEIAPGGLQRHFIPVVQSAPPATPVP